MTKIKYQPYLFSSRNLRAAETSRRKRQDEKALVVIDYLKKNKKLATSTIEFLDSLEKQAWVRRLSHKQWKCLDRISERK